MSNWKSSITMERTQGYFISVLNIKESIKKTLCIILACVITLFSIERAVAVSTCYTEAQIAQAESVEQILYFIYQGAVATANILEEEAATLAAQAAIYPPLIAEAVAAAEAAAAANIIAVSAGLADLAAQQIVSYEIANACCRDHLP